MSESRRRLLASLSPDLVAAIEALVDERVRECVGESVSGSPSPWLAVGQAADYLAVSERTLERMIATGRVRSSTLGRRRLLNRNDLDELARTATREDAAPTTPPRRRARTLDPRRQEA
jgi:excisionase family DNA binding protein